MSKYTTEVRFYCETLAGFTESQDYSKIDSIVAKAAPQIFDNFPIWDESYRLVLETKILKHYYVREICAETPALWKLWLNNRMNEIMPYFNKLYSSAQLDFNPFHDVDITRDHTGENKQDTTYSDKNKSTSLIDTSTNRNSTTTISEKISNDETRTNDSDEMYDHVDKYTDNPQGSPQGPIFSTYLTNARDIHDQRTNNINGTINSTGSRSGDTNINDTINGEQNQTTNITGDGSENKNTTENYLEHIYGKQGTQSYSTLLMEYRETLINIDMMIIEALSDLFFTLY